MAFGLDLAQWKTINALDFLPYYPHPKSNHTQTSVHINELIAASFAANKNQKKKKNDIEILDHPSHGKVIT